jgi:hypothetical protein
MGGAIFFVLMLAAVMIVGTYVFAYASHCFLTIVEQTSAGNDEVIWPNDPMYDWLWEAVYMLWLSALWLGPVVLAMRAVTSAQTGTRAASEVLAVSAAVLWLLFPITLLSSMSGPSRWLLLSPRLLSRLLGQRFGSLCQFYLHSGPILGATAAMMYLTFFTRGGTWFVVLTASGTAAAMMIYARQLGRLAHLVEHTRGTTRSPVRSVARRRPRIRQQSNAIRPKQPSELPPVISPSEGPITGYDVRYDDQPAPAPSAQPPSKRPIDPDDTPFGMQAAPQVASTRGPLPKEWTQPSEYEMSLARGGEAPPPPAHPWAVGVYNFPLYQNTFVPFLALSGGLIVLGLMIQTLIASKPT